MHTEIRAARNRGFTLIEIIITVAISIIVATVGVSSFVNFNTQQQITASRRELMAVLRQAQKKAMVGDKLTMNDCATLDGYRVKLTAGISTYKLLPVCSGVEKTAVEQTISYNGVATVESSTNITFRAVSGISDVPSGGTVIYLLQTGANSGLKFPINVQESGGVYESPAVSY